MSDLDIEYRQKIAEARTVYELSRLHEEVFQHWLNGGLSSAFAGPMIQDIKSRKELMEETSHIR